MCVEYGADLCVSKVGSGFPTTVSSTASEYYVNSPWNLNNFAKNESSALRFIPHEISGMKVCASFTILIIQTTICTACNGFIFLVTLVLCWNGFFMLLLAHGGPLELLNQLLAQVSQFISVENAVELQNLQHRPCSSLKEVNTIKPRAIFFRQQHRLSKFC